MPPSEPQYMVAIRKANEVRLGKAAVLRQVKAGEITAMDAIKDERCTNVPIYDVLIAQRQWGRDRTVNFLSKHGIYESKTCGSFTERQLRVLESIV